MQCKGFAHILPSKIGKTRRPNEFAPRLTRGLSRKWVGIWVRADSGVSRNEPLKQRRGFFLLCIILEAFFQVVSHFTFLRQEGQVLLIALHRHHNAARSDLMNPDLTRLTQREKFSPLRRERASRLAGHRQMPATAFRISFAGNPHPLQRTKPSAVFPLIKRFVQLCGRGREVVPH